MDFLQFINHIQKKITGKNRVHGIGQGHNSSANNSPDANGTAPLGYFNADMVDGFHARGEGVNLNSAYIPVAEAGEPNPNLSAEALFKVVSIENHWLKLDTTTKGSISRIKDDELVWNIAHYEPFTPIPLKDGTQPATSTNANMSSPTVKIEPSHEDNQAIFYGSALGIRGWGKLNAHSLNHAERGAIYIGAMQAGGIGIWTTNPHDNGDQYIGRLIHPTGYLDPDSMRDGSIPTSKLLGYLDNLTINSSNIANNSVSYEKLNSNLQTIVSKADANNIKYFSAVKQTSGADVEFVIDLPNDATVLSMLFVGGSQSFAGFFWTPDDSNRVIETTDGSKKIKIRNDAIGENNAIRISIIYFTGAETGSVDQFIPNIDPT